MSSRGHLLPRASTGVLPPSALVPLFGGRGPLPPHLFADPHFSDAPPFGRPRPPHHLLDDGFSLLHRVILSNLIDTVHLAATHVALTHVLSDVLLELLLVGRSIAAMLLERDPHFREAYERSKKLESELRDAVAMRVESAQILGEILGVGLVRLDLVGLVQALPLGLARDSPGIQQAPIFVQLIEVLMLLLLQARDCIEHVERGFSVDCDRGQAMLPIFVSMARDVERLRAELADAAKWASAAAAGTMHYNFCGSKSFHRFLRNGSYS